jgi:hypothetical protein
MDGPGGIGSVSSFKPTADARSGEPILGPYILPSGLHAPSSVFESIEEYFRWLISIKKSLVAVVGTTKSDLAEAQVTLKRLENLISESASGYDAAFLRGVPSHEDLSGQNVFINAQGLITGIIDWEFHMVKPAVLAAAYPSWIRYDGTADPRFVDKKSQFSSFWMASPVDAKKLRQEYDAVCIQSTFPTKKKKTNFRVQDCQRGGSRILPCFESRRILSHGRGMVVERWN